MSEARPSRPRRLARTVKSFLLWSHERGTWQYDVMVALIVIFVLAMPARYFHDQPVYNPTFARDVVRMDADADGIRYRVSAALLANYDDDPRRAALEVFSLNLNHSFVITRIEPIAALDGTTVWYDVWVRE